MNRPLTHGSVKLNAGQKRAFKEICAVLEYPQVLLAKTMGWSEASLSSATSLNISRDKTRSIRPDRLRIMEHALRLDFEEKRQELDQSTVEKLEQAFTILFPNTINGSRVSLLSKPGHEISIHAANRVEPHWEAPLRDYVIGRPGVADPARVWVLGGPMTGKTATLRRIESMAEDAGLKVLKIDLKDIAGRFRESDPAKNVEVAVLESILLAISGREVHIEDDRAGAPILAGRFLKQFREIIQDAADYDRLIVTVDHLYLFGPQDGDPNADYRQAFDKLLVHILGGVVQEKYAVDQTTLFIADDGAQTSHPTVSPYITKGKKLTLACDEDTVNAIWSANGVPIADAETTSHFDNLGRCIFLHHVAAQLATSGLVGRQRTIDRACHRVVQGVANGRTTGDSEIDRELSYFRQRVLAWLALKAVHCKTKPIELYTALTDEAVGLQSLGLPARPFAELLTALDWGIMFGDSNQPAGFLRELVRAEINALVACPETDR